MSGSLLHHVRQRLAPHLVIGAGWFFKYHRYGPVGVTWTPWCKKVYVGSMHFGRRNDRWEGGLS